MVPEAIATINAVVEAPNIEDIDLLAQPAKSSADNMAFLYLENKKSFFFSIEVRLCIFLPLISP